MRLVDPDVRCHASWLAAYDEFAALGEERSAGLPTRPGEGELAPVEFTREGVAHPEGFAALVRWLLAERDPATPRPRAFVPMTTLWLVEGPFDAPAYLGSISLRHELNEALFTWGGHIGYAVRPSARRRGHASAALRRMLVVARERGIDPVLVTCDTDNEASRRVIEAAGGVYEDTREGKRRYWIST